MATASQTERIDGPMHRVIPLRPRFTDGAPFASAAWSREDSPDLQPAAVFHVLAQLRPNDTSPIWTHAGRQAQVQRNSDQHYRVQLADHSTQQPVLTTTRMAEAAGLCLHWLMSAEVMTPQFPGETQALTDESYFGPTSRTT